ncbi:hypothetical protein KJ966_02550 [bacterium]|nr:hypothetical protein [bacterium]
MEETEYMALANIVPADWYTSQESVEITKGIFYDILIGDAMRYDLVINSDQDLQVLLEKISTEKNVPVEEILSSIRNISTTVGAVKLFNDKFPQIASKFPVDEYGNPDYPPKFLAKILEITEEIANELLNGVLKDYSVYLQSDES